MGKSLGAILTIGAAIAVNVIPGVGQFISGAIYSAGAGLGLASGSLATAAALGSAANAIAGAITLGVTATGLQSLGGVLGLGPSAPKPDTAVTALKTARPPRVSAYGIGRLYGAYILFETAEDGTAVDVFAVHDGEMTELVQLYLSDDRVTRTGLFVNAGEDGRYADNTVTLTHTLGRPNETAIAPVVSKLPGVWTNSHRGDGVVLLAALFSPVKSKKHLEVYPNGLPVASMAAKWQKCPDPHAADPTNPAGWTWTENPIRQLLHYKLVREGINYATKIAPAIDLWRAAAAVCEQPVPLKGGGTEPRYRSWVGHKHIDSHGSVQAALLQTCDGWIAPRSDGALIVYAGKYQAPTVSIGPEHIVAYEWQGVGVDDDEAVNELVCSYISAEHDYNAPETDAWRDEDDISSRGEVLSEDFSPQVPSWGQVRRLAKREMARRNAIQRGSVTTNVGGKLVRGHRFINLRLAEAGVTFFDGVAEITAVTRNMASGGVTFQWVKADPNIDAWNPATEEGNPAPLGDRIALEPLTTPTVTSAEAYVATDSLSARIRMTVSGPNRSDLTWYARWRVSSDAAWNESEFSDVDPGPSVQLVTGVVPANTTIQVAAAYKVGDGRISPWSATVNAVASDDTIEELQAQIADLQNRVEELENPPIM